jgi:3-isopropylmalate/(R)-2-methylmalate dehydratase large subunit
MTMGRTISEQILSAKARRDVRAGDVVACDVDLVVGTDASMPMAIDYFDRMNGERVFDPARIVVSLDHYAPPTLEATRGFHARVHAFADRFGIECLRVGDGISHQVLVDRHRIAPGQLIVGADSHSVTCGALNLCAVGVGSSDLAAAMLTGQVWLRVPETIRVALRGERRPGVSAKDVALALVARLGADGADYQAIEWQGPALASWDLDDRLVLSNMAVEMGAKAAIGPFDEVLRQWGADAGLAVHADRDAHYGREIEFDLSSLTPQIAKPHDPASVAAIEDVAGVPVQMVFVGTCTGGRASDFREVLRVIDAGGGRIADDVSLILTPASGDVERALRGDGTYARLAAAGGQWTTAGCGACCGTSGVIPAPGATVISTANRNFKARMGEPTASIYLASPAACAAAAVAGRIVGGAAWVPTGDHGP